VGIPARALPRFPARGPLRFEVCVSYERTTAPEPLTNCDAGSMRGAALELPSTFRDHLGVHPPGNVIGLEGRPDGWVGFAALHHPVWVQGDRPLARPILERMVADPPVDA